MSSTDLLINLHCNLFMHWPSWNIYLHCAINLQIAWMSPSESGHPVMIMICLLTNLMHHTGIFYPPSKRKRWFFWSLDFISLECIPLWVHEISKVFSFSTEEMSRFYLVILAPSLPFLGNVMGYPGVFQSNPCLYLSKPAPTSMGTDFCGYG